MFDTDFGQLSVDLPLSLAGISAEPLLPSTKFTTELLLFVVVLQRSSRRGTLGAKIEQVLKEALSAETFAHVDRDPFDPKYQQSRGICFEGKSSQSAVTTIRRICCPNWRVAAVVDRSGNVADAAEDLVGARFGFGGASAYAPDLVLVNEFRTKEFCEAVAKAGLRYMSQMVDSVSSKHMGRIVNQKYCVK